jgi:hypothetical protein
VGLGKKDLILFVSECCTMKDRLQVDYGSAMVECPYMVRAWLSCLTRAIPIYTMWSAYSSRQPKTTKIFEGFFFDQKWLEMCQRTIMSYLQTDFNMNWTEKK